MMFGRNSWWKGVSESCETFEIQCNFCDIVSGLQCAESSPLSSWKESCSDYCLTRRRTEPTARGPQEMLTASHPAVPCWPPSCRRIVFRGSWEQSSQHSTLCYTPSMARTEEGFMLHALLLLNHRDETQPHLLPHGCCVPGRLHRNCTVPDQHVKNSVKQTLTDQTYFYILSHLQTNSNNRKLGGFAFPMLGSLLSFQHSILHVRMTDLNPSASPGWNSNKSTHFHSRVMKHPNHLKCHWPKSWEPHAQKWRTT